MITRHAIGSGRALFTLPGGRFYNATKPLEGRILDMTDLEPIAWLRDLDGTGSLHVCAEGDPGAIAVSDFEATQARIAELELALNVARALMLQEADVASRAGQMARLEAGAARITAALSPQP